MERMTRFLQKTWIPVVSRKGVKTMEGTEEQIKWCLKPHYKCHKLNVNVSVGANPKKCPTAVRDSDSGKIDKKYWNGCQEDCAMFEKAGLEVEKVRHVLTTLNSKRSTGKIFNALPFWLWKIAEQFALWTRVIPNRWIVIRARKK